MTPEQREQFETDGYLVVPGALDADEVSYFSTAVDAIYSGSPEGRDGELLHALSAVRRCPPLAPLIDHPSVFPLIWSLLGWNIHVYHSHIDVHPGTQPVSSPRWRWHQDGGRQNRELDGDPRPRMSVKVAFWLSDLTEAGRGNMLVIPGSHRTNWLPGPPRPDAPWPTPAGAREVTAAAGDALIFDRRLWHARSDNHSQLTRRVVFFGYSYRWVVARDDVAELSTQPWFGELSPVQQQLLGHGNTGDHGWGLDPGTTPLYADLRARGLLDAAFPPLRP